MPAKRRNGGEARRRQPEAARPPIQSLDVLILTLSRPLTPNETILVEALKINDGNMQVQYARVNLSTILAGYKTSMDQGAAGDGEFDKQIGALLQLTTEELCHANVTDLTLFADGSITKVNLQERIAVKISLADRGESDDDLTDQAGGNAPSVATKRVRADLLLEDRSVVSFNNPGGYSHPKVAINGDTVDVLIPQALVDNPVYQGKMEVGIHKMMTGSVYQGAYEATNTYIDAVLDSSAVSNLCGRQIVNRNTEVGLKQPKYQLTAESIIEFPVQPPEFGTAQLFWKKFTSESVQLTLLTPEEISNPRTFDTLVKTFTKDDLADDIIAATVNKDKYLLVRVPICKVSLLNANSVQSLAITVPEAGWEPCITPGDPEPFKNFGAKTHLGLPACPLTTIPLQLALPHVSDTLSVFHMSTVVVTGLIDGRHVIAFEVHDSYVFINMGVSLPAGKTLSPSVADQFTSAAANKNFNNAANGFKRATAGMESPPNPSIVLDKEVYSNVLYNYQNRTQGGYYCIAVFTPVGEFCQGIPSSVDQHKSLDAAKMSLARKTAEVQFHEKSISADELAAFPRPRPQQVDSYKTTTCMGEEVSFEMLQDIFGDDLRTLSDVSFLKTECIVKTIPDKKKLTVVDCDDTDADTSALGAGQAAGFIHPDHNFKKVVKTAILVFRTSMVLNSATQVNCTTDITHAQAKAVDPNKFTRAVIQHGRFLTSGNKIRADVNGFLSEASPMSRIKEKRVDASHFLKYLLHPSSGKIAQIDFRKAENDNMQMLAEMGPLHPAHGHIRSMATFHALALGCSNPVIEFNKDSPYFKNMAYKLTDENRSFKKSLETYNSVNTAPCDPTKDVAVMMLNLKKLDKDEHPHSTNMTFILFMLLEILLYTTKTDILSNIIERLMETKKPKNKDLLEKHVSDVWELTSFLTAAVWYINDLLTDDLKILKNPDHFCIGTFIRDVKRCMISRNDPGYELKLAPALTSMAYTTVREFGSLFSTKKEDPTHMQRFTEGNFMERLAIHGYVISQRDGENVANETSEQVVEHYEQLPQGDKDRTRVAFRNYVRRTFRENSVIKAEYRQIDYGNLDATEESVAALAAEALPA